MLPIDPNSYDYRFNKTLNEDVKLKSDEYGKYDLDMDNGDYINITGIASLQNACIIAILTRYGELKTNPTYEEFGCRVHDLIKGNKTKLLLFEMETSLTETLQNMRRVRTVDYLEITESDKHSYDVLFKVTSINDETVKGKVAI